MFYHNDVRRKESFNDISISFKKLIIYRWEMGLVC